MKLSHVDGKKWLSLGIHQRSQLIETHILDATVLVIRIHLFLSVDKAITAKQT